MATKNLRKLKRRLAAGKICNEDRFPINFLRHFKPENWKDDCVSRRGVLGKRK